MEYKKPHPTPLWFYGEWNLMENLEIIEHHLRILIHENKINVEILISSFVAWKHLGS